MSGFLKFSGFKRIQKILSDYWIVGYGGDSNFKISFKDFYEQLQISSATGGGTPIFFEGNDLPSADNEGNVLSMGDWVLLSPGETYINVNGGDPIETPLGRWSIAMFNGDEWEMVDLGAIPGKDPVDEYSITTDSPLSGIAIGKGIARNFSGGSDKLGSAEDVKELNERVNFIDRPDLPYEYYLLDKNSRATDRLLSEKRDSYRLLPDGISFYTIDRPDLGAIILVDKDGYYLGDTGGSSNGDGVSEKGIILPNFEPKEQVGFNVPASGDTSDLSIYSTLIGRYDSILSQVNTPLYQYITKRSIGLSAVNDMPIELFSMKPADPKAKILLIGGTHAAEKMYIHVLKYLFEDIALNWPTDPFLNFLRWNVQIDVLPCRMPYVLSSPMRARGTRCSPETAPIPFTWTKLGDVVTLTFDVGDFPSDGFLTGDTYFSAVPASNLVNRQAFHVSSTSDPDSIPIGLYIIRGVNSGNSVTFNAPEGGASSGTGEFQVWVDPNRNMAQEGSNAWPGYQSNQTEQINDDGIPYTYMISKGTRPFSLRENRALIDLIEEQQYDVVLDGHAPANDNYLTYDGFMSFIPDKELILSKSLANTAVEYVRDSIASANTTPYSSYPIGRDYGVNFWTVEWGSGLNQANATQVKDAYRWLMITISEALSLTFNK